MNAWFKAHWLTVIAIAALLGALGPFPYVYYQLMDWTVLGAGLMTAKQAHGQKKAAVAWVFLIIAVIFNPVAPLYFAQNIWRVMDIAVAVIFASSFFLLQARD